MPLPLRTLKSEAYKVMNIYEVYNDLSTLMDDFLHELNSNDFEHYFHITLFDKMNIISIDDRRGTEVSMFKDNKSDDIYIVTHECSDVPEIIIKKLAEVMKVISDKYKINVYYDDRRYIDRR